MTHTDDEHEMSEERLQECRALTQWFNDSGHEYRAACMRDLLAEVDRLRTQLAEIDSTLDRFDTGDSGMDTPAWRAQLAMHALDYATDEVERLRGIIAGVVSCSTQEPEAWLAAWATLKAEVIHD